MTEEEFKTRFDLTCFSLLIGTAILGALLFKGCQYGLQKAEQLASKRQPSNRVASSQQMPASVQFIQKAEKQL